MGSESNTFAVVVHGGAGGSRDNDDGCRHASVAALQVLQAGEAAINAAAAAVVALEDDGRFNAGSGSVLCLDGKTVEMDAAVMDGEGRLGAVACLQCIRNPVLVALAVSQTPHWLLVGDGARRFARVRGFDEYYSVTHRARQSHAQLLERLSGADPVLTGVDNKRFTEYWNYEIPMPDYPRQDGGDTVGAVVRTAEGRFAVACSTGGTAPSLLGRVGDTPIIGSGFFAGSCGAVAVTGIGEHIVRRLLAHTVYHWIADGMPLTQALDQGIALFPDDIDVGIIAVSATEAGSLSNRTMPMAIIETA